MAALGDDYLALFLEGPRWVLYAVKGKLGKGEDLAPERNPKGPEKGSQKAFRGGGWIDSAPSVYVSQRNGMDPTTSMNRMGFPSRIYSRVR